MFLSLEMLHEFFKRYCKPSSVGVSENEALQQAHKAMQVINECGSGVVTLSPFANCNIGALDGF